MGSEIIRSTWGDGEHTQLPAVAEGREIAPVPGRDVEGERIRGEMAAYTGPGGDPHPTHVPGSLSDPLANMTEQQVDAARYTAEQVLADAPSGFTDTFDTLSSGLQRRVFEVMAAKPHLRGLDLVDEVERKLTLGEAAEAADWLRKLPESHKAWLRGER